MALYIYAPRPSSTVVELCTALNAQRLRKFDGEFFWDRTNRLDVQEGDTIICWGAGVPEMDGIRILNTQNNPPMGKVEEFQMFQNGYVATAAVLYPKDARGQRSDLLPRKFTHKGGSDLLFPPSNPDYFEYFLYSKEEYRVHGFCGKVIRIGKKVIRDDFTMATASTMWKPNEGLAHPWVRTFQGGWRTNYADVHCTPAIKSVAIRALKALGLSFGVVSILEDSSNEHYVIGVNSRPILDGVSLNSYVRTINRWLKGTENDARQAKAEVQADPEGD